MRVFVAGATGRVAEHLISQLLDAGHQVVAGARTPEKVIVADRVEPIYLNLTDDTSKLTELVRGTDAVYFTAGSRGRDLLQTDAFGAVKLMQAAEQAGIKRFIMLSSVFADDPERWDDPAIADLTNYNIAKFFADHWLMSNTMLDYTIIQPGTLIEAPKATGLIQLDVDHSQPNLIPNVAAVLVGVLERPNTVGAIIRMADGDIPVAQALDQVAA